MFSSCFLYAISISNIFRFFLEILRSAPSTYWLNWRWFLQIVDIGNFNMKLNRDSHDSGNLYPIYINKSCVSLDHVVFMLFNW